MTIKNIAEGEIIAEIKLMPDHEIYKGHFPGNPVVPGVVSVQMINEVLSEQLGIKLMTTKAKTIKFTSMINPNHNPNLSVNIKYSKPQEKKINVNAQITFENTVFLKFNGILTEINSNL